VSVELEPGIGALTMGGLLAETVAAHGPRQAIAFQGRSWTYDELLADVRALARGLLAVGAGKGTRVALLMGNRPEWVAGAFAVAMTGGVLVPVNTFFEPPELEYVLGHCDASVVLLQPELAGHDYAGVVGKLAPSLPYRPRLFVLGDDSWAGLLGAGGEVDDQRLDEVAGSVSPFDDALIVYTSGTTARPKGVLHGHRAPAIQSWRFAQQLCLDPDVRMWSAFPFFWTAGFCMVMGGALCAGGCLVLQERFEPGEALALLEAERVTSPHAWPHQLAAMEDHPDWPRRDLSAIRQTEAFTSFGRHPTVHVDDVWSPRPAYGLTETFTIISSLPCDTPPDRRIGAGRVLPGNTVRIVDGEICVKGPTMMKGYYKVAPEDCFDADGFFHTGDAGHVDDDGHLIWTGRVTELIKTGGANVSPVEIEDALLRHPGLKAAVAIGVPHPTLGEEVVVCAVAHDGAGVTEADVQAFLRGRIASYKVPRRVVFVGDDDLSFTGSAKIRADRLRRLAAGGV
jgi:fatty-acyl-CoA synthase